MSSSNKKAAKGKYVWRRLGRRLASRRILSPKSWHGRAIISPARLSRAVSDTNDGRDPVSISTLPCRTSLSLDPGKNPHRQGAVNLRAAAAAGHQLHSASSPETPPRRNQSSPKQKNVACPSGMHTPDPRPDDHVKCHFSPLTSLSQQSLSPACFVPSSQSGPSQP
ncbi:hypothetical protein BCR34DRAFT_62073 [Clohesyomyces aquaticus]|uniref:Uncharacterized protein n=1 Tax=Clohesyomyces aquaticus TaxID=1231657 RepID=A0A1Y2A3S8_9PLEO|nr:hypothetical protein BCR34DRAFT_62073 [Clohesyomyces aquaticus]